MKKEEMLLEMEELEEVSAPQVSDFSQGVAIGIGLGLSIIGIVT